MLKRTISFLAVAAALAGCNMEDLQSELVIHPVPKGIYYSMHNDDYTVMVRVPGGQWQDLYEYKVMVDMDREQPASMVTFDFNGKVEVMVKKNNGIADDVCIRPLSGLYRYRKNGNIVTFSMDRPDNISIEFDGDKHHNLHVFANPLETEVPSKNAPGVIWFGEGVHEPEDGHDGFIIPSNSDVYLAPGAVVKGALICNNAENIHISGKGMLLNPKRGIQIEFSKNITIDDIIVVNPRHYSLLGGQSQGITVRNLRSFSCRGWSDGIDMMSCSDVLVDGVFMRNSDDCIAVYGPRWEYYGDSRNITIQNSTLWADIAHPLNMGIHGYTADGKGCILEDITFRNIDILEHDEDDPDYEGCMAICCGDLNLIRNVLYEDIRVERIEEGRLFHIAVVFNEKYCTAPGRGIENVTFRNVSCNGIPDLRPSLIKGYDASHAVKDIRFENILINGRRMRSIKDFITNEFIRDINVE